MTVLMALPTGVLPARLAALPIQVLGIVFVFASAYLAASIAQRVAGYGAGRAQIAGVLAFAGVARPLRSRQRLTYVQGFAWGQQDLWQTARDEYRLVHYRGVPLWLRRDSPDVRWDLVDR